MAGCRSYLRGLSICVTVLLLVSGVVMIGVGFASIEGNTPVAELFDQLSSSDGVLELQVFGPVTVILSVLGICAAVLDFKPLLLVFSALIFVEFVAMVIAASPLVYAQTEMDSTVEDLFLNVTPLHKLDPYIQGELGKLQASDSCCGLRKYEDWGNQIPTSCLCKTPDKHPSSLRANSSSEGSCMMVDQNPLTAPEKETLWVHSDPCGPILKRYMNFPIRLRIGVISAFSTIAVTAFALSLALGLEKYWRTPPVVRTVDDYNRVKYQPKPYQT
ncbi:23 kDa integral membrane protein-like isoform X1 [Cheilinus undulatus]|uniref:23 kDa integral membrane protein-like isoform X1 n=1 Tax=Cheilinus undulatus TaxID=241271 RepID=UPI001BD4DEE0|nr:23 kDa integral membrane protein-like isoform X1 [Cheilinus undulatus]